MPEAPRGDIYAARARAARAYADLERPELGQRLSFSKESITRIENGEKAISDDPELRRRLAEACGLPPLFMEVGFAPLEQPITEVERRIYQLEARLGVVETTTRPLADVDDLAAAIALLHRLAGLPTLLAALPPIEPPGDSDANPSTGQ